MVIMSETESAPSLQGSMQPPPGTGAESGAGLALEGLVKSRRVLSLEEVQRLPKVKMTGDFRCVQGLVESDVAWAGVPVSQLLSSVEMKEGAGWILFGAEDYTVVLDLETVLRENTIIALERSGKLLDAESGGPYRLVFDGHQGFDSVKWVDRIEVLSEHVVGTAQCGSTADG